MIMAAFSLLSVHRISRPNCGVFTLTTSCVEEEEVEAEDEKRRRRFPFLAMLQFEELPDEIVLKIFSYLSQNVLCKVTEVSRKWQRMVCDPSLWKVVVIDRKASFGIETLLRRATMLRKLDVEHCSVDLKLVAKLSEQFVFLKQLCIPFAVLIHPAMLTIIKNCQAIEEVLLRGSGVLLVKDVDVLSQMCALKSLTVADHVGMDDSVFRALCSSCCNLQQLTFSTKLIYRNTTWQYLEKLCCLTSLSVSRISTWDLKTASKGCPNICVLKIGLIVRDRISATEALWQFKKLKKLFVMGECGDEWFETEHNLSAQLETFHVTGLRLQEKHASKLAGSCSTTLRHIAVSGAGFTMKMPQCLFLFKNLEAISIHKVPDNVPVLQILPRLPHLRELRLSKRHGMAELTKGLISIVDVTDCSEHGQTMLTVNMFCFSQEDQDELLRELYAFKEYLLLNTRLSLKHIQDFEQKWWQLEDSKLYWLPCGNGILRTIDTRFPVIGKRLRRLILTIGGH